MENGFEYDLVTIGAGSGGVRASRVSAGTYGAKASVLGINIAFDPHRHLNCQGGVCTLTTLGEYTSPNHPAYVCRWPW
jgi:hypothetical protein